MKTTVKTIEPIQSVEDELREMLAQIDYWANEAQATRRKRLIEIQRILK